MSEMPEQTVCLERERQSESFMKFRETSRRIKNPLIALVCFSNPVGITFYLSGIFLRETFKKRENNNLDLGYRIANGFFAFSIPVVELYVGYSVLEEHIAKYFY